MWHIVNGVNDVLMERTKLEQIFKNRTQLERLRS